MSVIQFTGPPKLVVTPSKLTLLDPFHRSLTQSNGDVGRPPHYTKTRAPAISSQSQPGNRYLSVSATPSWTEATAQPARKMGVASLLFHKTLSSKDALQVQSYTMEKQQQQHSHTQLQVHSYAREHQPRQLQHKSCTSSHAQVQPSPQTESKTNLAIEAPYESQAEGLVEPGRKEDKPKATSPAEAQAEVRKPEVEPTSNSAAVWTEKHLEETSKTMMDTSKNSKQKVRFFYFFFNTTLDDPSLRAKQ